jgi:HAD superfamily hydrolase (TIGR01490 family)
MKKVHIFDVDLTIIRKTSAKLFLEMALKEKIINIFQIIGLPFDWIKYKLALPDNDFIEKAVKRLSGIEKSAMENIAEVCFEKRIKHNIYAGAVELIKDAHSKGERVIFATSSFDFIVRPLEKYLGTESSLASEMEYINGKTTGKLVGFSFFGEKKKTASIIWMEKNSINPANVSFYSDSYTDIPLLEYCGNPVAVNPDSKLKRKAKKHGWKILNFKEVIKVP